MRTPSAFIDQLIVARAGVGGVVRADVLRRAGIHENALATRVATGWLERAGRGLYVIAHLRSELTPVALRQARWPLAVAAGRTAACMHCLDGFEAALLPAEVIGHPDHVMANHPRRAVPNLRRAEVRPDDLLIRGGLRLLKAVPTLVSLGALVDQDSLEAAVESVLRRSSGRHLDAAILEERIWRLASAPPTDRGKLALLQVMERRGRGSPATGSYLETLAVQRVLRPAGLSHRRQVAVWVGVDFVGRFDFELDSGLLVETHGMATHATKAGVQRDSWRATTLRLAGRDVESITWDDVQRRPGVTGRRLSLRSQQISERQQLEHLFARVGA